MFSEDELADLRQMQDELIFYDEDGAPYAWCRIYRPGGSVERTVDPVTLEISEPSEEDGETIFEGPMKIEATTRNYERSHTVGEARLTTRTHNLRIPLTGSENVRINDWLYIVNANDPAFAGLRMAIIDTPTTSTPTVRFLIAEDILNDNAAVV